jgi:hypothetical protein
MSKLTKLRFILFGKAVLYPCVSVTWVIVDLALIEFIFQGPRTPYLSLYGCFTDSLTNREMRLLLKNWCIIWLSHTPRSTDYEQQSRIVQPTHCHDWSVGESPAYQSSRQRAHLHVGGGLRQEQCIETVIDPSQS